MDEADPHDEIARLEERIEALGDAIERCRKIALMARIALGAGAAWIVLMLIAAIPFVAFNIVAAIAALLGGTVMLGSNSSTWTQTAAALEAAVARRNELISTIELRIVTERPTLH